MEGAGLDTIRPDCQQQDPRERINAIESTAPSTPLPSTHCQPVIGRQDQQATDERRLDISDDRRPDDER